MAAAGQWDELKAWQDVLDGGKMVGSVPAGPKDDLTKIEGIGPKIEEHLNGSGIYTYQELANASPDQIRRILDNAGGSFAAHDPTTWPQQAVMASQGQWDELKVWQDQLDGGKVVEAAAPVAPVEPEDLTKIEGIGPAIQGHLNAAGITTYAQLAATPANDIKGLLEAAGGAFATHDPTTWPQQSAMAAAGKWEELQVWQDELDGGKM